MIRVAQADKPPDFDALVGGPGQDVLWELEGDPRAPTRSGPKRKHLEDLWTQALPAMRTRYQRRCAYLALHIHRGTGRDTVDHFLPKETHRHLAYTWDNYRYACLDINRAKGTLQVLNPFEVEDDWFALALDTFKVEARIPIPADQKTRWENTLKIVNDPVFCDARRWYHERYFGRKLDDADPDDPMPYAALMHEAPFVAAELRRLGRLRPEDL